jgi:hypothetical protein
MKTLILAALAISVLSTQFTFAGVIYPPPQQVYGDFVGHFGGFITSIREFQSASPVDTQVK